VASIMAIVSKAVFEKAAGKSPNIGDVLRMDRYVSAAKGLASLGDGNGGKLYMVTVRPPNEALWLVGVLDHPTFDGTQWKASSPSQLPIVDISALKNQLKFETGKGITAAPGALGMSLQTPRSLNAHDIELLDAASGTAVKAATPPPLETTGERRQSDALLEALLDDPTSDDPRRVIADALLAKADPRGEFITLELALAGPLGIRSREDFAKRHAELLTKHGKTWFPTQLSHRRDRGFIASISGSAKKLIAEALELFATQPIVEVHASNVDAKSLKQLLDAPWLPRVHHLVLKGALGDAGWKALVSSPSTQQLEHLNVLGCKISTKGIGAIAGNLPRVRTLVLTGNALGDAGFAALRGWQPLADLQALYASNCGLTVKGVADLLASTLPHLEKLTLSQNKLGDPIGPALLAAAKRVPRLTKLELRKIGATVALLESLGTPKYSVDVRDNRIAAKDVAGNAQFRAA
jgi:uncharacterized protein (TIGR02996 family)